MGRRWHALPQEEQDDWGRCAAEAERQFYILYPNYKYTPRPSKTIRRRNVAKNRTAKQKAAAAAAPPALENNLDIAPVVEFPDFNMNQAAYPPNNEVAAPVLENNLDISPLMEVPEFNFNEAAYKPDNEVDALTHQNSLDITQAAPALENNPSIVPGTHVSDFNFRELAAPALKDNFNLDSTMPAPESNLNEEEYKPNDEVVYQPNNQLTYQPNNEVAFEPIGEVVYDPFNEYGGFFLDGLMGGSYGGDFWPEGGY